ncbi:ATP-binding protein [Streptomyces longispororuber]|uniref:ATP-binding protein n=1 Tax=Streptomyces longispororuber TaxID=68230 RepID=UPI0036F6A60D
MTSVAPALTAPVAREWSTDLAMFYRDVALARAYVRRQLLAWKWDGDVEDAVLILSELVTNAVHHARVVGQALRLHVAMLEDGSLLIDVSDPVPAFPGFQAPAVPGAEEERGRGLPLVRALGGEVSWFPRHGGGKTVRAHVRAVPKKGRR